jgi:putative phosphoesterase
MKVLVIADIHGNAEALRAVLDAESDADTTIFLGDSVLSGPQANETIDLLTGISGTFIMGNHDIEMLEPERFAHWPATWVALNNWIIEHFDPAGYRFLLDLKPPGQYRIDGMQLHLNHGELTGARPRNALPDTPPTRLATLGSCTDAPVVLFGHSHVQFYRTIGDRAFINPGSVGQNRCGRQLACYGVFLDGVYEPRHITYDQTPWLRAMDAVSALDPHPAFRDWLKSGLVDGFGIGQNEPWTSLAAAGYR